MFSKNEIESINLGYKLGLALECPSTILLEGDLGAGKTTFTKGIDSISFLLKITIENQLHNIWYSTIISQK
ncbi:MAG: tRNA (adenosine(37)-N6)-threonylcarbamoyltransferase complex ATPase subunit type 1 TsaE [bacterium]|nr:tRNA (adenosine(37)-N6)-threonylcarbamoyltransferase complex ATPase subunit type 1 TsaE [bacterium]